MNYRTPQVQPVGAASVLIQFKQTPKTDNGQNGHVVAASNLLDK